MSSPPPAPQRPAGEPTVALLLTWFVPGAGHLYLGRVGFALAAFLVVEGLYLLGLVLSGGMFLEYLPPEMRTTFAAALTPEAGNLGMLIYHVREFGYGPGQPRPWPSTMDLGTALTSASGLLNAFVMARAHLDARLPAREPGRGPDPALAAFATWIVPGLGHWLEGRRARAVACFVLLVGLFAFGTLLAQGVNLDRERHFYYWAGQFLLGLPAIAAEFLHGHPRMATDVPYGDAGIVLGSVAGMLNVLVMLDAFAWAEARHQPDPKPGRKGARTSAPPPGQVASAPADNATEATP